MKISTLGLYFLIIQTLFGSNLLAANKDKLMKLQNCAQKIEELCPEDKASADCATSESTLKKLPPDCSKMFKCDQEIEKVCPSVQVSANNPEDEKQISSQQIYKCLKENQVKISKECYEERIPSKAFLDYQLECAQEEEKACPEEQTKDGEKESDVRLRIQKKLGCRFKNQGKMSPKCQKLQSEISKEE